METLPQRLLAEVRQRYGIDAVGAEEIHGGSASKLWRLDSEPAVVLRLSQYYGLQDQQRSCRIAAELARSVAEVIPAVIGSDGESVFVWNGRPITVWPFVQGRSLDRQHRDELRRAGDLLARLHKAASGVRNAHPELASPQPDREAELLADPELDRWLQARHGDRGHQPAGWMHRDFFPGNVLYRDGRIVGLVDWDEVAWGPLIDELASAVWQFGKSRSGDALVLADAHEFLLGYQQAGGPVRPSNTLIPLMRQRLRRDIAFWRRVHAADPLEDRAKVDAFWALRHLRLFP